MQITVVGAGVVGCAVAYELASRGAQVRLIDPRGAGRGATGASAGILAPHIESHSPSFLKLALCSLASWDDFARRVQVDSGHTIEYARSGTLQVALDSAQATVLADAARVLQASGVECRLLDAQDAARLEPAISRQAAGALLVPAHGFVAPSQLVAALLEAAARRGAVLETRRVDRIDDARADARAIRADAVVVAAGSWLDDVIKTGRSVVTPIRGQLVQLRLRAPLASRVVWSDPCYLVPWSDGTVLVGATVEDVGFDERTTAEGVRSLIDAAIELAPVLGGASFEGARAGLRPKTADELPAIGRSSTMPHVVYATGHYRNGVLLAPLTAALIADLVIDGRERPELAVVLPSRFGL